MSELSKRPLPDQDPDYECIPIHTQQKRLKLQEQDAKEATIKKIEQIIKNQFNQELSNKETELDIINQRILQTRVILDRLRASIVKKVYASGSQVNNQAPEGSGCTIHPTAKKYLGKSVSLLSSVSSLSDKTRSDDETKVTASTNSSDISSNYSSPVLESKNHDDCPKTNRNDQSKEDSAGRRLRLKSKVRVIVGNVSKYILPEQREPNDQSTHKWMVYVRSPPESPNIGTVVKKAIFFLHPSYRPNDLVEVNAPFHLMRKGWGEFPVRVQLHFHNPRNKPVDVIHNLKLDKTYTGLQTLGAETVVDLWLCSSSTDYEAEDIQNKHSSVLAAPSVIPKCEESKASKNTLTKTNEVVPSVKIKQEPNSEYETECTVKVKSEPVNEVNRTEPELQKKIIFSDSIKLQPQIDKNKIVCTNELVLPNTFGTAQPIHTSHVKNLLPTLCDSANVSKSDQTVQRTSVSFPVQKSKVENEDTRKIVLLLKPPNPQPTIKNSVGSVSLLNQKAKPSVAGSYSLLNNSNSVLSSNVQVKSDLTGSKCVVPSSIPVQNNLLNSVNGPTKNSSMTFIKCTDASGKVLLIPSTSILKSNTSIQNKVTGHTVGITPQQVNSTLSSSSVSNTNQPSVPAYTLLLVPSSTGGPSQMLLMPTSSLSSNTQDSQPKLSNVENKPSLIKKPLGISDENRAKLKARISVKEESLQEEEKGDFHQKLLSKLKLDDCCTVEDALQKVLKLFPIIGIQDKSLFPYCASSAEIYFSWNIAKKRASEWSRAFAVKAAVKEFLSKTKPPWMELFNSWSTKRIMIWCRRFGYTPLHEDTSPGINDFRPLETRTKVWNTYSEPKELLSALRKKESDQSVKILPQPEEPDVDIVNVDIKESVNLAVVKKEIPEETVYRLPPSAEEQFVQETALQVGVKLEPLPVEPEIESPVIEKMILAACKRFSLTILQNALNNAFDRVNSTSIPEQITAEDVYKSIETNPLCDFLTNKHIGREVTESDSQKEFL